MKLDIEVIECEQCSDIWLIERAGVSTASMWSEVRKRVNGLNEQMATYVNAIRKEGKSPADAMKIAGYKNPPTSERIKRALKGEKVGDYTETAQDYAFRLACERISGKPLDEGFTTWAMRRGSELEPEARLDHESRIGTLIQHAGFVRTTDRRFGASADGLIGDDGGSEYKCLIDPARMRRIIVTGDISEFMDQVQGGMWLTGRSWWHFVLYCPALKPAGKEMLIFKVERDDDYIAELEADLLAFDQLVEQNVAAIHAAKAYSWQPDPDMAQSPEAEPTESAVGMFGAA